MKKSFLFTLAILSLPTAALAQKIDSAALNDDFAFASTFAGNFSMLLSIVIGLIATYLVFRAAKKLGGGLFGLILNYLSLGMILIVVGSIFTIPNPWVSTFWMNVISMASFATGYIFIVVGANKLFRGIMST